MRNKRNAAKIAVESSSQIRASTMGAKVGQAPPHGDRNDRLAPPKVARSRSFGHIEDVRLPKKLFPLAGRLLALAAVTGASLLVGSDASADIYSYTDADGVMHFTNRAGSNKSFKLYLRGNDNHRGGTGISPGDADPTRYSRYDGWIHEAATLYQIPEHLIRAVIKVESDFDPRAVSVSGARGLMQLMPGTADRLQVKDIDDPRENIFGGVRYLRILANDFNGDLQLTVAGYNAGEEAVMRYGGIPPYAETRDYVVRVTDFYHRFRSAGDFAQNVAPP
jgi:hypothetical protein